MVPLLVATTIIAVAVLLFAIRRGRRRLEVGAKTVASAAFVAIGALRWSAGDTVDTWLVVGLALCAAGDLLLVADRTFDLGLVSFLAGHLAYVAAFAVALPVAAWARWPAAPLAVVAAVVLRWLWPHLGRRRPPVTAYVVAISVMLWGALATAERGVMPSTVAVGAALFYLSDLAVARHRFVRAAFANRAIGLPIYYAGQILIAMSV